MPKSPTSILYIAVSKRYVQKNFIFGVPKEFEENNIINFLLGCPKDLIQLGKSFDYFEVSLKLEIKTPVDFHFIYEEDIDFLKNHLQKNIQVTVFLIDRNIESIKSIVDLIKYSANQVFFYFYNADSNTVPDDIFFQESIIKSPIELINKIRANKDAIISILPVLKNHSFAPKCEYSDFNPFISFSPTRINYSTLNQIVNNYWDNDENDIKEDTSFSDSELAQANKDSFYRQNLLLEQIKKIDWFSSLCYQENLTTPLNIIEPLLSPLILAYPFHNPQTKNIFLKKGGYLSVSKEEEVNKLLKLIQKEQTNNYLFDMGKTDLGSAEMFLSTQKIVSQRIAFIDSLLYLHSSFKNSPILRLPLLGKSINREISFFQPSTFKTNNRKKIRHNIYNLGKKMSDERISPDIIKYLKKRNGQIVALSDLPIEWLNIEGIPICFTHDICRIPEIPLEGVLGHFTKNNTYSLIIKNDVYKRILVIYGSNEPLFQFWRGQVEALKEQHGFNTAICQNINDVKKSIQKYNPEILIFDCHGGIDSKDFSTYLLIGDEQLTNEIIVRENISAPILFLSACGTAPNYGFFNSIAQGFFEAGAISVTTTFLPVDINASSILYIRLLNKLEGAIRYKMHKNWLEFLSHIVRTQAVFDSLINKDKKQKIPFSQFSDMTLESITDLLHFDNRRDVFLKMDKRISKINETYNNSFSLHIPEHLFYSHLGRPDLIYFEDWLLEKRKINHAE